ncbi:hypothetical protein F5879DRAFT_264194 [Lentinula edodes]|nr:hypothetical protein F5879DRAFT_264194 [Lentinula edodes]
METQGQAQGSVPVSGHLCIYTRHFPERDVILSKYKYTVGTPLCSFPRNTRKPIFASTFHRNLRMIMGSWLKCVIESACYQLLSQHLLFTSTEDLQPALHPIQSGILQSTRLRLYRDDRNLQPVRTVLQKPLCSSLRPLELQKSMTKYRRPSSQFLVQSLSRYIRVPHMPGVERFIFEPCHSHLTQLSTYYSSRIKNLESRMSSSKYSNQPLSDPRHYRLAWAVPDVETVDLLNTAKLHPERALQ